MTNDYPDKILDLSWFKLRVTWAVIDISDRSDWCEQEVMSRWNYFIILLTITYLYNTVENSDPLQCHYEQNQTWHVLGIYSACYNQPNRTKINKLAEDLDMTVKHMWKLKLKKPDIYKGHLNVKYISIDVCNNSGRLPQIVESIYLNETFNYKTWSKKSNKTISLSSILAIYAEETSEMMNYLKASFYGDIKFTGTYKLGYFL